MVMVIQFLVGFVLYVCFVDRCLSLFFLAIVLLRCMDSDYAFGVFKFFLVLCVLFCRSLFVLFLWIIVLSSNSSYPQHSFSYHFPGVFVINFMLNIDHRPLWTNNVFGFFCKFNKNY